MRSKYSLAVALAALFVVPLPVVRGATPADAKVVAEATNGQLKALEGEYFDKDLNATVGYAAEVMDLNGDGQPEVFTERYGGMFGLAGVEMNLYIKARTGQWKPQFGFPGQYRILNSKSQGYPDIEIEGPGTCFSVWRWSVTAYAIHKRCPR